MLIAFDVSQADIRSLAQLVESFQRSGDEYLSMLRDKYQPPSARKWGKDQWDYCQHRYESEPREGYVPGPCKLTLDLQAKDFYKAAAKRMGLLFSDEGRQHAKQTILGVVNGIGVKSLASRLGCTKEKARSLIDDFERVYPQLNAYKDLMEDQFAICGTAWTALGRSRRVTNHSWLSSKASLDLFISYKTGQKDKLWMTVEPVYLARHGVTCRVRKIVEAKQHSPWNHPVVYRDDSKGWRVPSHYFNFADDSNLMFRLPYRNIPYRIIRRARTQYEEQRSEGYDTMARALFNHMAQGTTADVLAQMMLRADPVCRQYDARMLIPIHDELVFECPLQHVHEFMYRMWGVLEEPPASDWIVPIVVEPKLGVRFGQMIKVNIRPIRRVRFRVRRRAYARSICRSKDLPNQQRFRNAMFRLF